MPRLQCSPVQTQRAGNNKAPASDQGAGASLHSFPQCPMKMTPREHPPDSRKLPSRFP